MFPRRGAAVPQEFGPRPRRPQSKLLRPMGAILELALPSPQPPHTMAIALDALNPPGQNVRFESR